MRAEGSGRSGRNQPWDSPTRPGSVAKSQSPFNWSVARRLERIGGFTTAAVASRPCRLLPSGLLAAGGAASDAEPNLAKEITYSTTHALRSQHLACLQSTRMPSPSPQEISNIRSKSGWRLYSSLAAQDRNGRGAYAACGDHGNLDGSQEIQRLSRVGGRNRHAKHG